MTDGRRVKGGPKDEDFTFDVLFQTGKQGGGKEIYERQNCDAISMAGPRMRRPWKKWKSKIGKGGDI